jgi:hypothetical protein
VTKKVSAQAVHPHFWRFLIRRIGDQVKRVASFECIQMAIPIGEGDTVDRSLETGWSAIRKRWTIPAH